MANRAEQKRGPRIAEIPERRPAPDQPAPTVPAALEKLASATQRVISKRIDLVTLESHELISALVTKAGLMAFGVVVGLAAWFAAMAALVLYLLPGQGAAMHLAVYAAINAVVGAIVVAFALREKLPPMTSEVEEGHADRNETAGSQE